MANNKFTTKLCTSFIILFLGLYLNACTSMKWSISKNNIGKWQSDKEKVILRLKNDGDTYKFISDTAVIILNINADKTASGKIGMANFENAKIKLSSGDPIETGISYLIKIGNIGKIYPQDPLDEKEVELWISPISGRLEAELRTVEGKTFFTIADLRLHKIK